MTQGKATKLTITIKRPSGGIEKVVHPKLTFITPAQFEQIKRETKAAGRGDVLSYEIEREQVKSAPIIKSLFWAGVQTDCSVTNAMTLNGGSK